MIIDVDDLEEWERLPVVKERQVDYRRKAASSFKYPTERLTRRQGMFYRNLIRIAVSIGREIPVDFELADGRSVYLDRGCIKIAERAGFIEPLEDGASGVVESIRLAWRC